MSIRSTAFFVPTATDIVITFTTADHSTSGESFLVNTIVEFSTKNIAVASNTLIINVTPVFPNSGFFQF